MLTKIKSCRQRISLTSPRSWNYGQWPGLLRRAGEAGGQFATKVKKDSRLDAMNQAKGPADLIACGSPEVGDTVLTNGVYSDPEQIAQPDRTFETEFMIFVHPNPRRH